MFKKIGILSLPVDDQARAKAFFCDMFGFEVVRDNDFMGDNKRWIELRPQNAETSIVLVTWFDHMPAGSLQGNVLMTDDIQTTYARLKDNGLADLPEIQTAPWGSFIELNDSEGNGWVVQQNCA